MVVGHSWALFTCEMEKFSALAGFCPECGSILPLLGDSGKVSCYLCDKKYGPEVYGDMQLDINIDFNAINAYTEGKTKTERQTGQRDKEAEGPVVERRCPACDNDKMSYATLQLRSADEGQTVFYTCTVCKFKETENS